MKISCQSPAHSHGFKVRRRSLPYILISRVHCRGRRPRRPAQRNVVFAPSSANSAAPCRARCPHRAGIPHRIYVGAFHEAPARSWWNYYANPRRIRTAPTVGRPPVGSRHQAVKRRGTGPRPTSRFHRCVVGADALGGPRRADENLMPIPGAFAWI